MSIEQRETPDVTQRSSFRVPVETSRLGRRGDHSPIREIRVIRGSQGCCIFGVTNGQIMRSTSVNGPKWQLNNEES
jgi:hypothetical protein